MGTMGIHCLRGMVNLRRLVMLGLIERIKNNVLLKCSTLNDDVIAKSLEEIINASTYHFAEELFGIISDSLVGISEEKLRNDTNEIILIPINKKIKRKLFIDSLALQITNDTFIEKCVQDGMTITEIKKNYIKELNRNKSSNQLNMTEDLKLDSIIEKVSSYVDKNIINVVKENNFMVTAINELVSKFQDELESSLEKLIKDTDLKYLDILIDELTKETQKEEREDSMIHSVSENYELKQDEAQTKEQNGKFDKYDDMTLFNKVILSLNTREEKLARIEGKLEKRKAEVEDILSATNKNIEANIERENELSKRNLDLNSRKIELDSKLSETEVILLNMKPLIKGLSKIRSGEEKGGNENE